MNFKNSKELYKQGLVNLVGAVNSPVRAFSSVGGNPLFIKKAKGSKIIDVDGNVYIDLVVSYGPMILGHRHKSVEKAAKKALKNGYSFGASTENEIKLAKIVCDAFPEMDKVRFVNSGTEAVISGVRLARAFTGKDKIIKFAGCYHGHSDSFLIQAGSGAVTFGSPNSPGVTQGTAKDTLLAKYNNIENVKDIIAANKGEIACIIIEPVAGNMGCIPPKNNFLQELRALCDANDILLVFDEVMTGFRLAKGGVQELYNVKADIVCFGKVIGGGLPVGAFAAKKEIMHYLAPIGPVYQAGTLSGNPLAMAAGLAMLQELDQDENIYNRLAEKTEYLHKGITEVLTKHQITHTINRVGSMISVHFAEDEVVDFETSAKGNNETFKKFFHGLLNAGVYIAPSAFETWFITDALSYDDLDKTIEAIAKVAKTL